MLTGSIVNALAIVTGSLVGILLHWLSDHLPGAGGVQTAQRLQDIVMKGVALCILYIGIEGCLQGENTLITILSMVVGAVIGELLDLDKRMQNLGQWIQEKTSHLYKSEGSASISDGFVTASLLFCVGAMAIVGALQDGLTGDHTTLFAKSLLDGISSIVLASSLGIGVLFAAADRPSGVFALAASGRSRHCGDDLCGFPAHRCDGPEHAGCDEDQGHESGPCLSAAPRIVPVSVAGQFPPTGKHFDCDIKRCWL